MSFKNHVLSPSERNLSAGELDMASFIGNILQENPTQDALPLDPDHSARGMFRVPRQSAPTSMQEAQVPPTGEVPEQVPVPDIEHPDPAGEAVQQHPNQQIPAEYYQAGAPPFLPWGEEEWGAEPLHNAKEEEEPFQRAAPAFPAQGQAHRPTDIAWIQAAMASMNIGRGNQPGFYDYHDTTNGFDVARNSTIPSTLPGTDGRFPPPSAGTYPPQGDINEWMWSTRGGPQQNPQVQQAAAAAAAAYYKQQVGPGVMPMGNYVPNREPGFNGGFNYEEPVRQGGGRGRGRKWRNGQQREEYQYSGDYQAVVQPRSSLLEEFRNNKTRRWDLSDIRRHFVEFASDQHGSRFIQQKFEVASPEEKQLVFDEIIGNAMPLMQDVFGNYVIQKIFEHGLSVHQQTLGERLKGHMLPLALQMYGCRVIQKALENIVPDLQIALCQELDGHVMRCVKDQNGNHVIQKCIECAPPQIVEFIIDAFKGQAYQLAMHPYGCRVLQRILEHCNDEQMEPIKDELLRCTLSLVQDQYGNYVIQHVLERGSHADRELVLTELKGHLCQMSCHKFASNVVEKCVQYATSMQQTTIVDEITTPIPEEDGSEGPSGLIVMAKDQYANYVIQKMMDICDLRMRDRLINEIRPHITMLRKYTYGKHIVGRLEKLWEKEGLGKLPLN